MSRSRQFVISGFLIALAVLLVGLFTGLRAVMHVALLSVATVAFFPFVVFAGGLALVIILAFAAALSGEDARAEEGGAESVVAVGSAIPRYYRWLAVQGHPLFWGTLSGMALGALLLWVFISVTVFPREAKTLNILADAREHIENVYAATGNYPEPVNNHLVIDGTEVHDGFGRPLLYERSGKSMVAFFMLSSSGYDGEKGTDDLCVSGSTRLLEGLTTVVDLAKLISSFKRGEKMPAIPDRLAAIQALRCEE